MEDYKEKLKSILEDKETPLETKNWIEKQFPELRESKDERIRKTFIRYAKEWQKGHCMWNSDKDFCNNAIAWLEKQCKPKFNGCGNSNTLSIEGVVRDGHFIDFECGTSFLIPIESSLANGDKVIVTIAKENKALKLDRCACQNFDKEYKSAREKETREPKFKVGDWIVNNDKRIAVPTQILEIEEYGYVTSMGYTSFDKVKTDYHLWTTQDAKDGDVLVKDIYPSGPSIFIFEEFIPKTFTMKVHCSINNKGQFLHNHDAYYHGYDVDIYPAAKEQRDLLFQKMKEVGYEWDSEKKVLKKIEQSHIWSEEDEKTIDEAVEKLEKYTEYVQGGNSKQYILDLASRVESLRPQPKQEFSEEDEKMLNTCLNFINIHRTKHPLAIKAYDWLKLLKPNHWKPSEEQMNSLAQAIEDALNRNDEDAVYDHWMLESLYNNLKKL